MRCPRCGHTNTPERLFCVSCAAELVPEVAEQFEPPRARTRRRRQAKEAVQVIHSGSQRFDDTVNAFESRWRSREGTAEVRRELRRMGLLVTAVVPGLAHLLQGERRMGRRLLLGALASLALWVTFMGGFLGTLGVWGLASLVVTSVVDAARLEPGGKRRPFRLRFALLGLTLMFLTWMVATQVLILGWDRVTVTMPIHVVGIPGEEGVLFHRGDHALFYKWAYRRSGPQRGDIIFIRAEAGAEDIPAVERVIGAPGDEVVFERGQLWVNGEAVPAAQYPLQPEDPVQYGDGLPLRVRYDTISWSGTVSQEHWLVWGANLPHEYHEGVARPTVGPTQIRKDQIIGKGWVLYSPYTHRRLL